LYDIRSPRLTLRRQISSAWKVEEKTAPEGMRVKIYDTVQAMAEAAAQKAAGELRGCIADKDWATFVAATGKSQVRFLEALTREPGVDWSKATMYHVDKYIGLPESHPASFRQYLERATK